MAEGRWIEVADRVLARRYAHLDQTLGLVVGDKWCLVVDTCGDEEQGAEFATAIRKVTQLPWMVAITHSHFDHYFGTAAFLPAEVWSHEGCRAALLADAEPTRTRKAGQFRAEGETERADRLDRARLVYPSQTFTKRQTLELGGRRVELIHPGVAHTDHDLAVWVPDVGVLFAGDLVEEGAPPAVGSDAHPDNWPDVLDTLLDLQPTSIVPGHGDPVGPDFVVAQRDELRARA